MRCDRFSCVLKQSPRETSADLEIYTPRLDSRFLDFHREDGERMRTFNDKYTRSREDIIRSPRILDRTSYLGRKHADLMCGRQRPW